MAEAAAPAPKTDAAKTEPKAKTVAGHALTAKITLGKNADGKPYNGTDNNPKRKGSKSFDKFAKYRDGMTVQQATDAGLSAADLSWDKSHGFISIA